MGTTENNVQEEAAVPAGVTLVTENKDDGHIMVTFSEGDGEAWADFFPPFGTGEPLTDDYINALLEKLNITYGVQWDAIQEAALACNLNKRPVKAVLIARGDAPVDEVSEYYEINPHLIPPSRPAENAPRIDYRAYSPFVIVKKDQALARLRPAVTGQDGQNVHGAPLPHRVNRPEGVSGGKNTRKDGKFILSEINGQLIESKKVLNVQESLVIKGSVGYATGNILFPGDVVIEGLVSDGFKIYSGGSVTIKQTFDVTDAITKGDLTVAGGIIGRGRALVKVGGSLRTKFIENCRVACRGSITAEPDIINSSVFTMEPLELGDKGIILGGDIYAIHGLRAGGIGKKSGKTSQIHCGIDFTLQQEKENDNNRLRILAAKLAQLRGLMAQPVENEEKKAKMEELLRRLEDDQKKTGQRIADILGKLNQDENATVEVGGEIVPGTLIEICQVALFVTEPLRKVRIRLDKAQGKLVTMPL
jgi:uncharacterized protein (DUF342 family)